LAHGSRREIGIELAWLERQRPTAYKNTVHLRWQRDTSHIAVWDQLPDGRPSGQNHLNFPEPDLSPASFRMVGHPSKTKVSPIRRFRSALAARTHLPCAGMSATTGDRPSMAGTIRPLQSRVLCLGLPENRNGGISVFPVCEDAGGEASSSGSPHSAIYSLKTAQL
jgi:hypothetical protein